jgi:hypothetical protein
MTAIQVIRIYTDSNGNSQFADVQIPLNHIQGVQSLSDQIDIHGVTFAEVAAGVEMGWHAAARYQYVITLSGEIVSEVPSGEQRTFRSGVIALVEEDPKARGHNTTVTSDVPWRCVFLPLKTTATPPPLPKSKHCLETVLKCLGGDWGTPWLKR